MYLISLVWIIYLPVTVISGYFITTVYKLSLLALILYVKELGPTSEKEVIKKRGEDVLGTNSQKSERCPDV